MNTQSEHRNYHHRDVRKRNDLQIMEKIERMVANAPRPKVGESDESWNTRHATFVRKFRSFFAQHRSRLQRLEIRIEDFGLLDTPETKSVPIDLHEDEDPRYLAAEEKEVLDRLARKGAGYERLG